MKSDNNKSILWILDDFYPVTGAPAIRIHSFLQALSDHSCTVIGGLSGNELPINTSYNFYPVKRPPETSPFLFIWFLFKLTLRAFIISFMRRPSTIVISVPKYECLFAAVIVRPFCRNLIIDFRDSFVFLDYIGYLSNFIPRWLAHPLGKTIKVSLSFLVSLTIRIANIVTVANCGIKEQLVRDFDKLAENKFHVISNGVDLDLFCPKERTSFTPLRLVYLGNFAEKDDFSWIIEKAQNLRNLGVVIHLIGDGRNRKNVITALEKVNVDFHYNGIVEHRKLPELLAQMHVGFIFRSSFAAESIPVAIYEFSAMNIPTLTNRVGLMASFVEENGLGACPTNSDEFIEALSSWTRDHASLISFNKLNGLARRNFSRQAEAQKFRDIVLNTTSDHELSSFNIVEHTP